MTERGVITINESAKLNLTLRGEVSDVDEVMFPPISRRRIHIIHPIDP